MFLVNDFSERWSRWHYNLTLTSKSFFYDNYNFITRMLFKGIYWSILTFCSRVFLPIVIMRFVIVLINEHDDDDDDDGQKSNFTMLVGM